MITITQAIEKINASIIAELMSEYNLQDAVSQVKTGIITITNNQIGITYANGNSDKFDIVSTEQLKVSQA